MNPKDKNGGFTLIEILLYSVILAVFLGATFAFLGSILGSTDTLLEQNEVLANQEFVERKLDWLVSYATAVTAPATNTSSTVSFTITTASSSLNPAVFSKNGNELWLSLAGGVSTTLTGSRVKLTDFIAEKIVATSSSPILKIYFALESTIYKKIIATTSQSYVIE